MDTHVPAWAGTLIGPHGEQVGRWVRYEDYHNTVERQIDLVHSDAFVVMFLGFLVARTPVLHTLPTMQLLDAWAEFKQEMGKESP